MILTLQGIVLTDFGIVAVHNPIEYFRAGKGVRSLQEGEGGESPVDAVHPEVLREVVRQILPFLLENALKPAGMSSLRHVLGPEIGCRRRGDRPGVPAPLRGEQGAKEARFVLSLVPNFTSFKKQSESRWIKRKNSSRSRPSSSKKERRSVGLFPAQLDTSLTHFSSS